MPTRVMTTDPMMQYFIQQMHQHSIQAQQFQQALLHMQATQNQMLTQLTVGTTTTAAALHNLSREKLKPTLVVPPWTQSTKREWLPI
eukprot:14651400-Ditylum_brightwellii.AAC.1